MPMTYEELASIIFTLPTEQKKQCVTIRTENGEYFPVKTFTKTKVDDVLDSQHCLIEL